MIASPVFWKKIIVQYFRSEIQGHHAGCLSNLKAASLSQSFNNIEFVIIMNSIPTKAEPKGIQSNVDMNSGQKGLPCHFSIMWNWVQKNISLSFLFQMEMCSN